MSGYHIQNKNGIFAISFEFVLYFKSNTNASWQIKFREIEMIFSTTLAILLPIILLNIFNINNESN